MPSLIQYLDFEWRYTSWQVQISRGGQIRRVSLEGLPQVTMSGCIGQAANASGGALLERLAVGPEGLLYATDRLLNRIYTFGATAAAETNTGAFEVASDDGSEIYYFSPAGLHQATVDAQTGAELLQFTHDAEGRLESITDRDGRVTRIERPDSSTIQIIAPAGPDGTPADELTTTLTLNTDGYVQEVSNPRGAVWSFEYRPPQPSQGLRGGGLLAKMWDPRANEPYVRSGTPYDFEFEAFNGDENARWLLKRDTDPVGGHQTLSQQQSYVTQSVPGVRTYPILGTWCDGTSYTRGYSIGETTSTITKATRLGRETVYETTLERGSPRWARRTHKREGRVTTTRTDPSHWSVTRQDPDSENQGSTSWNGGSLNYALAAHPRLGSRVMVPKSMVLSYDAVSGHSALRQDVEQSWTTAFTPAVGYPKPDTETVTTIVTPASGTPRTSATHYDGATRTTTATSPETRTSSYVLDAESRLVRLDLPGQLPTIYEYDADGFLEHVIRCQWDGTQCGGGRQRRTTFDYDQHGYVNSVQNRVSPSRTDEVTMDNDDMGFARYTTVPQVLTVQSTPDITGALASLLPDGKATPHQLSYSPLGQLSQYASPAGALSADGSCPPGTQCWHYSLDRELDAITLPDGSLVDYNYHGTEGTLEWVDVPGHGRTTFQYDLGRRVSATAPASSGGTMTFGWQSTLPTRTSWQGTHTVAGVWSGTLDGTVERFYNDFLEVSELHVTGGVDTKLVRDDDGLLTRVEEANSPPQPFAPLALVRSPLDGHVEQTSMGAIRTDYELDIDDVNPGFGDLLGLSASSNAGDLQQPPLKDLYDASYTYDDRGRIDTWTESLQGGTSLTRKFGYDGAGRLLTVYDITGGEPGTPLEEYIYDGNGNRQKAVSSYPGAVPLNAELGTNLGCTGPSGDTAANDQDQLCRYGDYDYVYNARGQLQNRSTGGVTTDYTYDGLGRLKRVTEPGMDIHYVHDALGRRIGKIRDGNLEKGWLYADALNPIAQLDSAGDVEATFIYGTRAHVPDAMVMADDTVYRFITDHVGSVRLVVNAETGAVVQRMDYDAFGRVLQDTNEGFQPFGFAGGLYDDDTGLVRFGARDYDAYAGRWTAKDASLFQAGDANLYAYSYLDPINFVDVDGRHPLFWIVFALIFVESDANFSAANLLDIVPLPCPKGIGNILSKVRGKTVLGRYPVYLEKAAELNARRFDVPPSAWDKMSDAERWGANQRFLDRAIERGDEIVLASPVKTAEPGTYFARELEHLQSRGYRVSADGTRMVPPSQ